MIERQSYPVQSITLFKAGDRVVSQIGTAHAARGTIVRAGDLPEDLKQAWHHQTGGDPLDPDYLVMVNDAPDFMGMRLGFPWDRILTALVDEAAPAKEVFYVAHPVSGDITANVNNVISWIKWLTLNDPSRIYIAPWVAEVLAFQGAGDEIDAGFYDRVLADDVTVVRKLDGILMVGGTISRGMGIERDGARPGTTIQDWSYARTPADLKPEHIEALGCQ